MPKNEILTYDTIAAFERIVNKDERPYDPGLMVLPGTLQERHKKVDPKLGIPALRRGFHLIYLLLDGPHDIRLDEKHQWLKPHDLVIVPESLVYASGHISECKGFCLEFNTDFLQPILNGSLTDQFPFFDMEAVHIISLTAKESHLIQRVFLDLIEVNESSSREKSQLLRDYVHILLLLIRDCYKARYTVHIQDKATRAVRITNDFKHLVEKNFKEMHEVQQYANLLNITPKHLSDVVRSTTGKPPHDIINNMLLLEAKALLTSTDKPIAEIAYLLNFDDQSHFSHFIKRKTGQTPLAIRKVR
ncbi:helix-turn-helix domain-containing protein [Pontibacter roseus]|uniref:helix-turn-helix domain-containing protein n=1 Tax=Pontibacter roseus TaxID=336989 RepID=UPI000374FE35|nr:helix-turn-helix domain-containing protein [Pontibacter roseus]